MLKTVTFAPIPIPRVNIAITVKPGDFSRSRTAWRRSWSMGLAVSGWQLAVGSWEGYGVLGRSLAVTSHLSLLTSHFSLLTLPELYPFVAIKSAGIGQNHAITGS